MRTPKLLYVTTAVALILVRGGSPPPMSAQQAGSEEIRIDSDDIGGVVSSTKGPEPGVWVIAETSDLPTSSSRLSSRMIAAAMYCPISQKRTTRYGSAVTALSIRRRSKPTPESS